MNDSLERESMEYDVVIVGAGPAGLSTCIKLKQLTQDELFLIFIKLYPFFKYFNNNYRPIYHLENFIIYLCKTINGF